MTKILRLLLEAGANVNYCRTVEEPNELLHSIFKPNLFKVLLEYGLDTKTFFKQGYSARFLALALHSFDLGWYKNIFTQIVANTELDQNARAHYTALNKHIETTYRQRFQVTEDISGPVFVEIQNLFGE